MNWVIMKTLVPPSCILSYFYIVFSGMEKSTFKISQSTVPTSVSVHHGLYKSFSILSKCNSFSSCSNDSAIYSDSQPVQPRFRNRKRMNASNQPTDLPKRSRNSSGSSMSSNISCISDRDVKSCSTVSQSSSSRSYTRSSSRNNIPQKSSKNNSKTPELKGKSNKKEKVPCIDESVVISSNRHNLRGKITKKGCACCPSTRTTVVVRRYQEIVNTSEEKTVISSTKVKTYVEKGSLTTTSPVSQINAESNKLPSKSKANRKRRSEVEKLYESLHEIEWAKNFSPDNILRQIKVRQAASCSLFGRSQKDSTENFLHKNSKRQKVMNSLVEEDDLSNRITNSKNYVKQILSASESISRSTRRNSLPNCDSKQKMANLQTKDLCNSDIYHCKPNYSSCTSQSSVNITCSMAHINTKEISINTTESVHRSESLVTVNSTDYSDDAQLSYTSDESSSAVSSSIVNLQSKHLLDFDYKDRADRELSDADMSEYSATPTFFDIAEEGIRTIDACFREVGAEVVVSTCYDEESSLPLLTCIKENGISNKSMSDDGPPILEPCFEVTSNKYSKDVKLQNKTKNEVSDNIKRTSKRLIAQNCNNKTCDLSINPNELNAKKNPESQTLKKCYAYFICRSSRDILVMKTGRRILNKYLKWLCLRSQLKCVPKKESDTFSKASNKHFNNTKACSEAKTCQSNLLSHYQGPVLTPVSLMSDKLSSKAPNWKKCETDVSQNSEESFSACKFKDRVMFDYTKNGSCLYATRKALKVPDEKLTAVQVQSCVPKKKSVAASSVTPKVENVHKIKTEKIIHTPPSFGFTCNYTAIRVNRSNNYTQIILKLTRGKSIFLTLEALSELRDALVRADSDSSCKVLIVNGIGDSFCLGLDLRPLVGPRKKLASEEIAVAVKDLIIALSDFKKPLAAVVNGPAVGLGMTLLNHADFTIASETATFCMPHSNLGYIPEGGATLTLPQAVGPAVAMDLLLRGRTLTAREARNIGLISEVLEAKRLPHELVSRVRTLAGSSLTTMETTKALIKMQLHVQLHLVLANEVKLLPRMWLTQTCQDALRNALRSGILSE